MAQPKDAARRLPAAKIMCSAKESSRTFRLLFVSFVAKLPLLSSTPEEFLAEQIARRLLSHASGRFLGEALQRFSRNLQVAAAVIGLDEERLDEALSASWHGHSLAPDHIFQKSLDALIQHHAVEIEYHSPGSSATTRRVVEPHHLQQWMSHGSSWPTAACAESGGSSILPESSNGADDEPHNP